MFAWTPVFTGCETPGERTLPASQVDRIVAAYPGVDSGHLVIIADFEDSRHTELFHVVGVSQHARCTPDDRRGRAETGAGGLVFSTGSPHDTLVVSNQYAENWYLKRDWRAYDLLFLSVHAPQDRLAAELAIAGGRPREGREVITTVPLQRGWNIVRLDTAELGERIPLDDVREIRLAVKGHQRPIELVIDDVFLARSRRDLFGDSQDRAGGLYVQQVGRRFRVGAGAAGGGFELTFANGQIVEWYNRSADPYRAVNLVRGSALGPTPEMTGVSGKDRQIAARTRIVEAGDVRVVVASAWQFPDRSDGPSGRTGGGLSSIRWIYTIYPQGALYVTVETSGDGSGTGSARTSEEHDGPPVLALSLAQQAAGWETDVRHVSNDGSDEAGPSFATARNGSADAYLLFSVYPDQGPVHLAWDEVLADGGSPTETPGPHLVLRARREAESTVSNFWHCHLLLGRASDVTDQEASARAAAYVQPAPLRILAGSPAAPGPNRERANESEWTGAESFDPGTGCYALAPDRGRARFILEGGVRSAYAPCFAVAREAERMSWVYVNHVLLDDVVRDARGYLVFTLPSVVRDSALIEVLLQGDEN